MKSQFSNMARADKTDGVDIDDLAAAEERRLLQYPADVLTEDEENI